MAAVVSSIKNRGAQFQNFRKSENQKIRYMSKLYLIRHAQASCLSYDYDNLSEHGHNQSRELGNYFFIPPLRTLYLYFVTNIK